MVLSRIRRITRWLRHRRASSGFRLFKDSGGGMVVVDKLNDFIRQVDAQRGKALTDEQADLLVNYANNIIALI